MKCFRSCGAERKTAGGMPPPSGLDPLTRRYLDAHGADSAYVRVSRLQAFAYAIALLGIAALFLYDPYGGWLFLTYLLAVCFGTIALVKCVAIIIGMVHDASIRIPPHEIDNLDEENLPSYTVMVPLFREPEVVPTLLRALEKMDYPVHKREIFFLLEPEDTSTLRALQEHHLPPNSRIVFSPGWPPRTKPRACNAGLEEASGELLVIYDAEDLPEADQMKKAAAAYRKAPKDVACIQARLAFYNAADSIFSRWAAMEYTMWYRFFLPGLQSLGAAVPLGGTSNHFRTAVLKKLGGWDPFNVAEDCDLGLRIARAGYRTVLMDSTTWEEAVTDATGWIRQRTRWLKGYIQTWLVHSRIRGLKELGFWKSFLAACVVGGAPFSLLAAPPAWLVAVAWFVIGWKLVDITNPLSVTTAVITLLLAAGNVLFTAFNAVGCALAGRSLLVPAALLSPIEWVLLSAATWRAFFQLAFRPFLWEKTSHGTSTTQGEIPHIRTPAHAAAVGACTVLGAIGLVLVTLTVGTRLLREVEEQKSTLPVQMPLVFGEDEACGKKAHALRLRERPQAAHATGDETRLEIACRFPSPAGVNLAGRRDWSKYKGMRIYMEASPDAPPDIQPVLHIRDADGWWYQHKPNQRLLPGKPTIIDVPFDTGAPRWFPRGHDRPFNEYTLLRVTEFGISLYSSSKYLGRISVGPIMLIGEENAPPPLRITCIRTNTDRLKRYEKFEVTFNLSRSYSNPFDPDVIKVDGTFTTPSGKTIRVPAFFYQDYRRMREGDGERLRPIGPPAWKIRFAPTEEGRHRLVISAADSDGNRCDSGEIRFTVKGTAGRGYVRRSEKKPRYLCTDDGRFFYPIGHNICHPVDRKKAYEYEFSVPPDRGTFSYDGFMEKMSENGENWGRVWLTFWHLGLEGPPKWRASHGLGFYNMENAWKLDHILQEAEEKDIYLNLTLDHYSEFKQSWRDNPYNRANGGPLARPWQFFVNSKSLEYYKKKLRYVVARWGYSTHVMAWELWGEVNLVPGYKRWKRVVTLWHKIMAAYLKRLDPWKHLVFSHCHDWQKGYSLWRVEEIDCVQGNGYIRPPNVSINHTVNFARYVRDVYRFNKPIFVAEYGGRSELGAPSGDYLEAQLHTGLWSSILFPFAGAAMHWWWNFIDGRNLYFHYRALSRFTRDIDRLKYDLKHVRGRIVPKNAGGKASGMIDARGEFAFFWVYDLRVFKTLKDISEKKGLKLEVSGLRRGMFEVEYWNTYSGEIIDTRQLTNTGTLTCPLPSLRGDMAVKIYYRP